MATQPMQALNAVRTTLLALPNLAVMLLGLALTGPAAMARDVELDNRLSNAADAGDIKAIEKLIAQGADVNTSNSLAFAAASRKVAAVKYLLEHGANPNASLTPISRAVKDGDLEMLRLLLAHGAKIDVQVPGDTSILNTPLIAAVYYGDIKAAKILLDFGAKPNLVSQRRNTALHQAIRYTGGDAQQFIRLLVQYGADPDIRDGTGLTARQAANMARDGAPLRELLDRLKPPSQSNKRALKPNFTYSLAGLDSAFAEKATGLPKGSLREAKNSRGVLYMERGEFVPAPGCKYSKQFNRDTGEIAVVMSVCGIGPYDANAIDEMMTILKATFPVEGLGSLPANQRSPEAMAMINGMKTRSDSISTTERRVAFMLPIIGHGVFFIPTVVILDNATDTSTVFQFGEDQAFMNTERVGEIAKQIYRQARH